MQNDGENARKDEGGWDLLGSDCSKNYTLLQSLKYPPTPNQKTRPLYGKKEIICARLPMFSGLQSC
jgi:hypothetical protein